MYCKYRMKTTVTRLRLDEQDPARLLEVHRELLSRLRAQGWTPEPARPERALELQRKAHAEAAEFYKNRTIYTWSDALHESFGIIRREFLKD